MANSPKGHFEPSHMPDGLPDAAQWLGGVGAGSWFYLSKPMELGAEEYRIQRFDPQGKLECDTVMRLVAGGAFDANQEFRFVYLSHCLWCTVEQGENVCRFEFLRGW